METDLNDFAGKMNVKKSENNKRHLQLHQLLRNQKKEAAMLQGAKNKDKWLLLTRKLKRIKKNKFLINPSFGAKVLAMSIDPIIPAVSI